MYHKKKRHKKKSKKRKMLEKFSLGMKRRMTRPEYLLWVIFRWWKNPFRPRRQFIIGNYITDFAWLHLRIVLEVDGKDHLAPAKVEADQIRTRFLKSQGWRVFRISNEEVLTEHHLAAEKVAQWIGGDPERCNPNPYDPRDHEDIIHRCISPPPSLTHLPPTPLFPSSTGNDGAIRGRS